MNPLTYSVAQSVFDQFPDYVRGVVFAVGVTNGESSPELIGLLRAAESALQERWTLDTMLSHPPVAAWRDAFRKLGVKASEYRPSVEALARRVLRGQPLPTINALVDIGNLLSLQHLVPIGAHAIDAVTQDLWLRHADGTEEFVPFGSDQMEHPARGEIVFVEGNQVLTRRWIWRQATRTSTWSETRAIEFNIDALPPVSGAQVEQIAAQTAELIGRFCGGESRFEPLTRQHPQAPIPHAASETLVP
jgi:DNA/RNA-binding domain of Phe-tRNA-synthetase-like protein